ncbi:MAG TPA: DUF1015 domain-containing protein [Chloroflexota bacterium]|nr:DUF1015 domain-containing protein [Chloroflexota bacterium]
MSSDSVAPHTYARALRAVRYDPGRVDMGRVLAPPYDVLSEEEKLALCRLDRHNVVRIDNADPCQEGGADGYELAAKRLSEWLGEGVLVREPNPSVYVVEHEFRVPATGGIHRRIGLLARLPALPWSESRVRPHERTHKGPKEDRLRLMKATHLQTSPVFVVWDGAPPLGDLICASKAKRSALFRTEFRRDAIALSRVDHSDAVNSILAALEPARWYIADGHHRYETAVAAAAEAGNGNGGGNSGFILTYCCSARDPSLVILPTHRMIAADVELGIPDEGLPVALGETWKSRPAGSLDEAERERERLKVDGYHAFAVITPGALSVWFRRRREGGRPRGQLDITVLHEEVFPACGIPTDAPPGQVEYSHDAEACVRAVREHAVKAAFLTSACSMVDVMAVADARETMPQKSTYFFPKVPTGLAFSPL